jgi:cytochrome c peroxidase
MRIIYSLFLVFCFLTVLLNCTSEESRYQKERVARIEKARRLEKLSKVGALPLEVKTPFDNPISKPKIVLGKALFFDPVLSGDKDVACATCHHPNNGWAEFRDISIGVNGQGFGTKRVFKQPNNIPIVKRNAHTILNTAYNGININNKYSPEDAPMFWDNRVASLEKQALEPIKSFEEMRGTNFEEDEILNEVVTRLKTIPEYQKMFKAAFGGEKSITVENLGKAIATFERVLTGNNSRFDQFIRGDEKALSLSEQDGFELFKKAGCGNCHNGPMFTDYKMHILGVPENKKLPKPDSGFEERFAFRTPTLRNLRFTAPYMHNGSIGSLKEVLEFYEDISQGKERNLHVPKTAFDSLVNDIDISVKDMSRISTFLSSLNDTEFDKTVPESVPSGLPVGGDIQ